jgi:hypothetical protein
MSIYIIIAMWGKNFNEKMMNLGKPGREKD